MATDPCATRAEAVEILSPLETGAIRRRLRDVRSIGKPVRRAGVWSRRAARSAEEAGQLADLVRRGQARPPPSHTWRGPCCILPEIDVFARPTRRRTPTCRTRLNGPQ